MTEPFFETPRGHSVLGDSLEFMRSTEPESIDLIVTSPPFGLLREKEYGNVAAEEYVNWFRPFGMEFLRLLRPSGSLVIDIGGSWVKGKPTRSLYHFRLLIMLCEEIGFHLAQEFYWWNPSKLPSPAEWVNIRRIRVKDAVNPVFWLSKTPWPKATNRRVLQPYSDSMKTLLKHGYQAKLRPSGHDISGNFMRNNGGAIPPNLIAIANTESNSQYQRYCRANDIAVHPARYPAELPEYFVRMLTDEGDLVLDPFAGSCVTGEVCERLERNWICVELEEEYLTGAKGRFRSESVPHQTRDPSDASNYYQIPRPDLLWDAMPEATLLPDGGRSRPSREENQDSRKVQRDERTNSSRALEEVVAQPDLPLDEGS